MTIGQRIKFRREELGITQDELAVRIGYKSRSSINKIELDIQSLTQSKIKRIADALQTTPSYIMGWDEEENLSRVQAETEIAELISKKYGMGKVEAFNLLLQMDESETSKIQQMLFKYMQLDQIDRAEVRGYIIGQIDQLLSSEKYSVKKGLKNA